MENKVNEIKKNELMLRVIKILNVVVITMFFACAWYSYYADRAIVQYYKKGHWLVIAIFAVAYLVLGKRFIKKCL